ncbi:probable cytochrome P450 6a13 [Euwallacea similis]|uniref:probable cytochrome P450 6a13 n=1 Tax=Euwallacea similis TaxID=1736056 RepID=UPI00344F56CD
MILLYVVLVLVGFFAYVKWRHTYWQRKGVVNLPTDRFFGYFSSNVKENLSVGDLNKAAYNKLKLQNKTHAGLYRFTQPVYLPIDPSLIKRIMTKDFHYFMGRGTYHHRKDTLTMNLFNLEGEQWKYLRTKLTPTFTSGKMKMMFETLLEKTDGLQKAVAKFADNKESFTIKEVVARFTTDIIASCAFGIECNSQEEPDNEFRKNGAAVFNINPWKRVIVSLFPRDFLATVGFKINGNKISKFFIDVVKETIKSRETNEIFRKDFMHLLLQLKNQEITSNGSSTLNGNKKKELPVISEDDIIAQCFIFFLAGFETSSTTMTFALLSLAENPEIQDKLRREIQNVLDRNDGKMTYDAIMNMPYLDNVINETLRKYPPLPILPRKCSKNYRVPNTNVIIDKGTLVAIPVWGLQMDPEYYPNPEVFDPDRFDEKNKASRPDFTFLPFGEGPRMCIGLRFGIMQTKVGLVSLLSNFKFSLNENTATPIKMNPKSFILAVDGEVWLDADKV